MNYLRLLKNILQLLSVHKQALILILLLTLIQALLVGAGDPVFFKLLIDSLTQGNIKSFIIFSLALICISTFARVSMFLSAILTQRLKNNICKRLALRMFEIYYQIPYSKIANKDPGYFISRIYDEPSQIAEIVDTVIYIVSSLMMFISAILVCLWLSWKIAIVLSIVVPFLLYFSNKLGSRITTVTKQENEGESKLREGLGRAIGGYKTVNLFGFHGLLNRQIRNLLEYYLNSLYLRVKHSVSFQTASGVFLSYAETAVIIGAGIEVLRSQLTVGGLLAFMSAYWRVVQSFEVLISIVPTLARLKGIMERLEDLEKLTKLRKKISSGNGIELKNIDFRYNDNLIFKKFNLTIQKGEKVLIVGQNGSGKSTLAHIMSRFSDIHQGDIRLPELNKISALLLPFGFIPGSLQDNVNYQNLSETKNRLFLKLIKMFNLQDKVENDPISLSEGEKKKFQVIMTLLKDADFYIFDEPLANVDIHSRNDLMNIILNVINDKALIVIMHGDNKFKNKFDKLVKL